MMTFTIGFVFGLCVLVALGSPACAMSRKVREVAGFSKAGCKGCSSKDKTA